MRKAATATVVLVALAAVVLAACTTDGRSAGRGLGDATARSESAQPGSGQHGSAGPPKWLFTVQSDGESTFDAATGRLSIPSGSVQAFTDRPYRDSRAVTPQSFVNLFHRGGRNSFAADPPNAVLTYWDDSTGTPTPRTAVCEASGGAGVSNGRLWVGLKVLEPAGATLPARLPRASLFVDDVPLGGCPTSPTDEQIVEYFNELVFNEELYVPVHDTGPAFQLSLSCPPKETPEFPPPNMEIRLAAVGGSSTVTCNTGAITIPKATMTQQPSCAGSNNCLFEVTLLDENDGDVFSTTEVRIALVEGGNTVIPDLNPAVMPICPLQVNQCLLTGECTLSTRKAGSLQLCESATSCTPG